MSAQVHALPNARSERLYDLAAVLRSKNAGPLFITFDIIFDELATYRRVVDSGVLTPTLIGELYAMDSSDVQIMPFEAAHAIKITIPRKGPTSGAPGDRDVYGAQQHVPLIDIRIP